MDESTAAAASSGGGASPPNGSRFGLAPPRRFILPAVLLLLSEQPGYGYSLARRLEGFHFGRVDRPAVYRALAQLEADRLIEASSENPRAGQARRVYRVTPLGERVLRSWMGVVAAEHECLGSVLRRFQASHTVDAVLACVEGSWATALDSDWSALSPTWPGRRRLVAVDDARALAALGPELGFDPVLDETDTASNEPVPAGARRAGDLDEACDGDRDTFPSRFHLLPDCSVVLVEVRSTAGPLSFGLIGVTGTIECVSRG
ncbi:MAG: PadR family transcriptional regulator, partial [Acidimicrobiales bacterium]